MKLARFFLAITLVIALLVAVSAQSPVTRGQRLPGSGAVVPANAQALSALQNDLATAIQSMEAALPIYDGYRVKSIHAAHRALAIVDHSINRNATTRPASKATDTVKSHQAHSKYNQQQIAQSQQDMEQGLAALNQAQKDLQAAAGSNPNKHAYQVQKLIAKAIQDATTAIGLHATTRP